MDVRLVVAGVALDGICRKIHLLQKVVDDGVVLARLRSLAF